MPAYSLAQLPLSVLPVAVPALPKQPSSSEGAAIFFIQLLTDTNTSERIQFIFAGGTRQNYAPAEYQIFQSENGDEYMLGQVCIKLADGRRNGGGNDWEYAIPSASAVQAGGGWVK
jgi:hypothetical protein